MMALGTQHRFSLPPLLTLLLPLLLLQGAACTRRQPDIVLISVDTLRPDHMSIYGYDRQTTPRLDAVFAAAAIYERSYATNASTSPSVSSILSGLLPQQHGVRLFYQLLDDEVPLITDFLPPEYESAAFVSNAVLRDEAIGIGSRFDYYDDFVDQPESSRKTFERNAEHTTNAALAWLGSKRNPDRPLFLWLHYIDPHGPYRAPETWRRSYTHDAPQKIPLKKIAKYQRMGRVDDGLAYVDAYDEEITYLDREIGRLIDGYSRKNDIDQALLVFTADHGESMMEHVGWFTHGYHVYEEIIRVPLLLRGPGVDGGIKSDVVSSIDILPTVLGFAGIPVPERFEGVNLIRSSPAPDRVVFAEAFATVVQWRAAIQGNGKWMVGIKTDDLTTPFRRHYDLSEDPHELSRMDWSEPGVAQNRLLELIAADPSPAGRPKVKVKGRKLEAPAAGPEVSEQHLEILRALGYVE